MRRTDEPKDLVPSTSAAALTPSGEPSTLQESPKGASASASASASEGASDLAALRVRGHTFAEEFRAAIVAAIRTARHTRGADLSAAGVEMSQAEWDALAKPFDELLSATKRFDHAMGGDMLARLASGRAMRAAEDGRGSGPLPLGYRLGEIDDQRTRKHARGARWRVEIDPEGAQVVRRVFALARHGLTPGEIAAQLAVEGTALPTVAAAVVAAPRDLTLSGVQAVLRHEDLYRTGRRVWAGVEAKVRWPVLLYEQPEDLRAQTRDQTGAPGPTGEMVASSEA